MIPLQKHYKKVILAILLLLVFGGGVLFGFAFSPKNGLTTNTSAKTASGKVTGVGSDMPAYLGSDVDFKLFWQAWDTIHKQFVDKPVSDTKLLYGAISGMVSSLGDPYSVFFNPDVLKEFEDELLRGEFEGIGAEIGIKQGVLTIIAPLPETPAEKAGLKAGDKILAVDTESTSDMTVDQAVSKIRGAKGTPVVLSIYREGFTEAKDITVIRSTIQVDSVRLEYKTIQKDNQQVPVAWIKVLQFNDQTTELFDHAVNDILSKNVKNVIVDVRNNPGGYLSVAIDLANEWVDSDTIVIERKSDGTEKKYQSGKRSRLHGLNTVVLINQGSASASEILAGALQDYGFATLVGHQSFGKGSVQTIEKLFDGSAIKITISKWLTPKGRTIQDEGITPDVAVDMTDDDYNNDKDPQMDTALELLAK